MSESFDVIVVGSGAAGLMGALAAGTKGGPVTDTWARVAARILGPGINAGGATIASALVLGFRAGMHLGGN